MENIFQPAEKAYSEGVRVRIYLSEDDPDARYHGLVCEVIEDISDGLGRLPDGSRTAISIGSIGPIPAQSFRFSFDMRISYRRRSGRNENEDRSVSRAEPSASCSPSHSTLYLLWYRVS